MATQLVKKVEWLAQNAEAVAHQRVTGSVHYSLHHASYRIIYDLDKTQQQILVVDFGQHDEAYNRVQRLK